MYMLDMKPVFMYLDLPTLQGGLRDVMFSGKAEKLTMEISLLILIPIHAPVNYLSSCILLWQLIIKVS